MLISCICLIADMLQIRLNSNTEVIIKKGETMSANQTPVVFTGKGSEYFGIWIVNLLLSIVTLGIYSAWAKVRRKKYFYNNTLVDGVGFDYHANPINILKGRIIAFVLFVLFQVMSAYSPIASLALALLLFIALPWIIVRGMVFNARNSSHRGLRFNFVGTYGQAAKVFIGYTLLIFVTLGLAIPFVAQRTQKFVISNHKFGTSNFKMEALVKDFYKIYLVLFIIPLIGIIAAIAIPAYQSYKNKANNVSIIETPQLSYASANTNAELNPTGFIKVADVTTTEVPAEAPVTEESTPDATAVAADAAAEGAASDQGMTEQDYLKDLTPAERAEYDKLMEAAGAAENGADANLPEPKKDPLAGIFGSMMSKWGVAAAIVVGLIAMVVYLSVIFSFVAYMKSRIHNLVFNNTTLEHIGFFSNQRMRDLLFLYVTNGIVLLFTLGLATPWAQIRMAKYTADHLALTGETNWDKFVGEKKDASRALGEEIADMFDVDISFG